MRWHDTAFRLPMETYLSHTSHEYEDMHDFGLSPCSTHRNGGVLLDRFCPCLISCRTGVGKMLTLKGNAVVTEVNANGSRLDLGAATVREGKCRLDSNTAPQMYGPYIIDI